MTAGQFDAVVFDYFGTLTPTLPLRPPGQLHAELAEALGIAPDVLDAWWATSYEQRATGRTGDLAATLRQLVADVDATVSPATLDRALAIRTASYQRMATPRQQAPGVLAALRASGLRIGVLSDCSAELPAIWPGLSVAEFVQAPVFSCEVGQRKPHPRMYRAVCTALAVRPARCVYVGDGGSNELTGASAAGLRAVLLADAGWAGGHRYNTDDWHGETIHDLTEVLDLLSV